jgi:glycine oxidase
LNAARGRGDVVVVGAGVLGCSVAYWLSKQGFRVTVIEKEGLASGASGMSLAVAGVLTADDSASATEFSRVSRRFRNVAAELSGESGIDVGFREDPFLRVAFGDEEAAQLRSAAADGGSNPEWLDRNTARLQEPLLGDVVGALRARLFQVLAYPFCLALMRVAETHGALLRPGVAEGIERHDGRVAGVRLKGGEVVAAPHVVLAMGPWTALLESAIGIPPSVYPMRGQLLVLRERAPQLSCTVTDGEWWVSPKADGTVLAAATHERDSGFDSSITSDGRDALLSAAIRMVPSLADATIKAHLAGLRAGSHDQTPLVGEVPEWPGLYLRTGHEGSGFIFSLPSAMVIADLIHSHDPPGWAAGWSPARFRLATEA